MHMLEKVYVFTVCCTEHSRVAAGFIIKTYFTKLVDCQPEIQKTVHENTKLLLKSS